MSRGQFLNPFLDPADKALKRMAPALFPYYRRWRYDGPLWISEVDLRGAWSRELGFFYARLPKVANTTILGSLVDAARARGVTGHDRVRHFFARPRTARRSDVEWIAGSAFKFAFVRDPFARTLSAYLDKIVRNRPEGRRARRWFAAHGIGEPDFTDFCRYLDDGGINDDPHWARQTDVLVMPLDALDFVGRMERLHGDLCAVHCRLFGASPEEIAYRGPRATGSASLIEQHYSDEAYSTVRRLYAEDFSRLGYAA